VKADSPGDRKVIDVAAGLVFHAGKLLITQRYFHGDLGGLWEFPGGKLEQGESFGECLKRELMEELGIKVRVVAQLEEITHSYPEKTVRLKFFQCTLEHGEAEPHQCQALAWISREQLIGFQFPAADARLLRLLEDSPGLWHEQI